MLIKNKRIFAVVSSFFGVGMMAVGIAHFGVREGFKVKAGDSPYALTLSRSVNASEIAEGQAIYNTNRGAPITFKFDSSKAENSNNGVISLLTDGYFYNDTIINGMTEINLTLSGGSATFTYGNDKNNMFSSQTLNTGGEDNVPFTINPGISFNYFRLSVDAGPSLLKNMSIDYSCVSSEQKTPLTILFQGDSITDNSRSRTNLDDLGGGYASMVAKQLEQTYGESYEFTFINRAHSGWNLIDDWNAGGVNHYQEEFYQYNADIVTILIGYNDIMDSANSGGVSDADFEACYRELLEGLTLRGTKAVCLSAFSINENRNEYVSTEFPAKRKIVHDLAEEFNTEYIDMKPYMMQAVEDGAHKMELFGDLTHPWAAGNRIICDLVVDKISTLIDNSYSSPLNLGAYLPLVPASDNNEDYTNKRAFLVTSHGKLEYDTSVYYNRQDFSSTKSVKMTNELYNPEQSNAYVKALFDFTEEGKKDLTSGTLTVDIKIDNFLPVISFRAHSGLTSSGVASDLSTIYSVYLSDSSKAEALGDGWYEITINLNAWASEQTNTALANAIAIDITASKGESENSRQTYNVDGTLDSYMWMDNLRFELTSGPVDYHAAKESFTAGTNFQKVVTEREYNIVTFEYQITSDSGSFALVILNSDWNNGFGYFNFGINGPTSSYNGVESRAIEDDWIEITIRFTSSIKIFGSRPDKVCLFFVRGANTTCSGYLDHISFAKDDHPDKEAFTAGSSKTIATTEDSYTSVTFNYIINNEGYMNVVILDNNWDYGYGYFKLTRDGIGDPNVTGITTTALGAGWISVTIDFDTATIFGGQKPDTVALLYLRGGWTTANGYIENVTFHK